MEENKQNQPQKNDFWDMFRFTKNGRPKSAVIVMTFSYSLLFLAVYMLSYYFLIDVLNAWLGDVPVLLANVVESLVPVAVGAGVCALPLIWAKEKQDVPMAYVWLVCYALGAFLAMMISLRGDAEARALFAGLFAMTVPAPLVLGGGLSLFLYRRHLKNNPPLGEADL